MSSMPMSWEKSMPGCWDNSMSSMRMSWDWTSPCPSSTWTLGWLTPSAGGEGEASCWEVDKLMFVGLALQAALFFLDDVPLLDFLEPGALELAASIFLYFAVELVLAADMSSFCSELVRDSCTSFLNMFIPGFAGGRTACH